MGTTTAPMTVEQENRARWTGWRNAVEAGLSRADSYDFWLHPDHRVTLAVALETLAKQQGAHQS